MITTPFAQWDYDRTRRESAAGNPQNPGWFMAVQSVNMVAYVAGPLWLTTLNRPNVMSYAYKGMDPMKVGFTTAMKDRRTFQRVSSPAYQLGKGAGKKLGMKTGAKVAGRIGARLVPGLGWAMLAYDAYDLVANKRLFGVEL